VDDLRDDKIGRFENVHRELTTQKTRSTLNWMSLFMNRRMFINRSAQAVAALPLLTSLSTFGAAPTPAGSAPLSVAVLTGGHLFDVPNFHKLFRGFSDLEVYIQTVEDFVATPEAVRDEYDVVVFYHMLTEGPAEGRFKTALEHLGTTRQGLVLLHHAILAYPAWPFWSELVGIPNRSFGFIMISRSRCRSLIHNIRSPGGCKPGRWWMKPTLCPTLARATKSSSDWISPRV